MPYITQRHSFAIDPQHPTDVFDELENFFSLYTTSVDSLPHLSIGLTLPNDIDIHNKKIANAYQQFCQTIRYSVPDVNILPIKNFDTPDKNADDDNNNNDEQPTVTQDKVILFIQYLDQNVADNTLQDDEDSDDRPSFFGRLFPTFLGKKSADGVYPAVEMPEPILPPQPSVAQIQPHINRPVNQPITRQTIPNTVTTAQNQQSNPQTHNAHSTAYRQSSNVQYLSPTLPSISQQMRPSYTILVEKIAQFAMYERMENRIVTHITLNPQNSVSRALIEQIFASFASKPTSDSIDMVSFGFEWLKPALQKIGVVIADDTGFELKTKTRSTADDIARLQRGQVSMDEIVIDVRFQWI